MRSPCTIGSARGTHGRIKETGERAAEEDEGKEKERKKEKEREQGRRKERAQKAEGKRTVRQGANRGDVSERKGKR